MTTGQEMARGEKGTKVVCQERCSSRGSMRIKAAGMGETLPQALRSSGSKWPNSPRVERVIGTKQREGSNGSPTVDELLKTVKRLEKGFLSLADAVIAEIEGMKEDARSWQEERDELWKTVVAFHTHQKSDMEPVRHRLDCLENRTSDIEEHLQSRDPDTGVPVDDRLEELENQVKQPHAHLLHSFLQTVQEKPVFKEELEYRGHLEEHRSEVETRSNRLGPSSDSEEATLPVRKEIDELIRCNIPSTNRSSHRCRVVSPSFEISSHAISKDIEA